MIFEAFPKINVFLKITGIDTRGYHFIDSRFCIAKGALKDVIEIKESDGFSLKGNFDCSREDNLIFKALQSLKKYLVAHNQECKILDFLCVEVQKNIPTGAGLGGGSADAAAVLVHLNQKYFGLDNLALRQIAQEVGLDSVFFVSGYDSANVHGLGEKVESFQENPLEVEILTPKIFCNTKQVYQQYDKSGNKQTGFYQNGQFTNMGSLEILKSRDRFDLNDLLSPALMLYPELREFESSLDKEWFFSGSGSSFFRLRKEN